MNKKCDIKSYIILALKGLLGYKIENMAIFYRIQILLPFIKKKKQHCTLSKNCLTMRIEGVSSS